MPDGAVKASVYLHDPADAPPHLALPAQERACADACERLGLEPGRRFVDRGDDRGDLQRLLLALRAGDPTLHGDGEDTDGGSGGLTGDTSGDARPTVVVAALDVLGDTVRERALRALQVEALGGRLHVAGGRSLEAPLLETWQRRGPEERRRERAVESMRRRALRGHVLGRPPYGYQVDGRRLVPEPAEADVVRRIFVMYLDEHEGVRRIAARLNAEGLRTRRGAPWNQVSVRALLRNPVYTGTYRRLGVTVPRAHPALVSTADFEAVQRRMVQRRTAKTAPSPPGSGDPSGREHRREAYLLAGLVWCGYCGGRMIGARRAGAGGPLRYYQCTSRTNQGRCARHSWRADALEAAVFRQVEAGSERSPLIEASTRKAGEAEERRRRGLLREFDRMLERWASGQWTMEQLRRFGGAVALDLLAMEEEAAPARAAGQIGAQEARARLLVERDRLDRSECRALLAEAVREVLVTDEGVRVTLA